MQIALIGGRGVPALYSGFETAMTEIGARLAERGHEVTAYCRPGYGDTSEKVHRGMRKQYVPSIPVSIADTLSHTFFCFLHAAIHRPDVLVVLNPANGPLTIVPRALGIPFGINVDGLEWERAKWPWIGRKYFYFASWMCTKIAPAIIADSRGIGRFYKERWNAPTYYASYGGWIEKSTRPALLEEFGVKPRKYFLVVARLEPENNAHIVVDAFSKLDTDMELIVVGKTYFSSSYMDNLIAGTKDPRVRFLGGVYEQDKLTELICNSFAYVHGHMVGGTNPILLKALGCGACVLYSDVSFNAEVVEDAGIPFPIEVDGAAAVFQDLIAHPEKAEPLREKAPHRIEEAYTWDLVTDRYEQLCYALVEGRSWQEDSGM